MRQYFAEKRFKWPGGKAKSLEMKEGVVVRGKEREKDKEILRLKKTCVRNPKNDYLP